MEKCPIQNTYWHWNSKVLKWIISINVSHVYTIYLQLYLHNKISSVWSCKIINGQLPVWVWVQHLDIMCLSVLFFTSGSILYFWNPFHSTVNCNEEDKHPLNPFPSTPTQSRCPLYWRRQQNRDNTGWRHQNIRLQPDWGPGVRGQHRAGGGGPGGDLQPSV